MKIENTYIRVLSLLIAIYGCCFPPSWASSETYTNQVTVEVPPYLFIQGSQRNLDLTFSDYHTGSETEAQTVIYTVMGNGMMQADGAPAITARLGGTFPNIDLKARVNAYTKQGGNTELGAVLSDYVTVKDSETVLARKANSTSDGKLLRGTIEIAYKAVAQASLETGKYSQDLTVTLTDV